MMRCTCMRATSRPNWLAVRCHVSFMSSISVCVNHARELRAAPLITAFGVKTGFFPRLQAACHVRGVRKSRLLREQRRSYRAISRTA